MRRRWICQGVADPPCACGVARHPVPWYWQGKTKIVRDHHNAIVALISGNRPILITREGACVWRASPDFAAAAANRAILDQTNAGRSYSHASLNRQFGHLLTYAI